MLDSSSQPLTDREFRLFVEAAYWLDVLSGECHHAPQVPLFKSVKQIAEEVGIVLTEDEQERIIDKVIHHA